MITKTEQLSLFEQLRHSAPRLSDELVMRRLCLEILKEAEVSEPPVPVKMLASLRGIASIEEVEQPFAGMLQPGDSGFEVRVRRRDGRRRQRFTICHEAGHTLLPGFRQARQFRCNGERSWLERMCDVAGAELLLPHDLLRPLLPEKGLDLRVVEGLADAFEASVEATSRRAVSLSRGTKMMLVLSERHKPSEVGREDELPASCVLTIGSRAATGRLFHGTSRPTRMGLRGHCRTRSSTSFVPSRSARYESAPSATEPTAGYWP